MVRQTKRLLDQLGLVRIRGVIGVDQRRREIAMSQPLLKRPQRHAGRGAVGAEGVAQVVEADAAQAGSRQRLFEALTQLRIIERVPGIRVGEYEVVIGLSQAGFDGDLDLPLI